MKQFLLIALLFSVSSSQAQKITPEEAKNHIGDSLTVCGKVFGVYQSKNSKGQPTYINFGAKYPKHVFTALVWGTDRKKISLPLEELVNKEICVCGRITLNKEKPEVIIKEAFQIQ